jgi:hypothetical protein
LFLHLALVIQHRLALKEKYAEGAFHESGDVAAFIVSGSPGIRHLFALPAKRLYESLKDSLSHASG